MMREQTEVEETEVQESEVHRTGIEKITAFFQAKFTRSNLLLLVFVGILLLVIGIPTKEKKETEEKNRFDGGNGTVPKEADVTLDSTGETLYIQGLERRLEEILSQMDTVGKVKVMITLRATEEKVPLKDSVLTGSRTKEIDGQGGEREIVNTQQSEETICYGDGTNKGPFIEKTLYPAVEGVLIVAQGADTGKNNKKLSEIAQALFGVDANRIRVVKMQMDE